MLCHVVNHIFNETNTISQSSTGRPSTRHVQRSSASPFVWSDAPCQRQRVEYLRCIVPVGCSSRMSGRGGKRRRATHRSRSQDRGEGISSGGARRLAAG